MKKTLLAAAFLMSMQVVLAQVETPATDTIVEVNSGPSTRRPVTRPTIDLANRSGDHVVVQFGVDSWGDVPDSIRTKGFSRHFNIYFMLDKPFKTNPRFSVAFGAGIGSSNIFFDRTYVDLKSQSSKLPFTSTENTNGFKKFKLATVYAEAPVELRFSSNAAQPGKSVKAAIGAKVGLLISAHTKGKDLESASGETVNSYIQKEKNKKFINGTRLSATARVGYGMFSLHGSYQFTNFLREGVGPEIHPLSIGLTISGL